MNRVKELIKLNEITQKVIDLDKATIELKKKYEDKLRITKFEGQDRVLELEQQLLKAYMEEGEKAYQDTLIKSDKSIDLLDKVKSQYEINMEAVDKAYRKMKPELTDKLWQEILIEGWQFISKQGKGCGQSNIFKDNLAVEI